MLETALSQQLRERIRNGPLTFRDWMAVALYDPNLGYYCTPNRSRWGRKGDYQTSPEYGTLFAAALANYFRTLYAKLASPTQWTIVEAGAGSGNFAGGLLETFWKRYPHLASATKYVIDERSVESQKLAQERLVGFHRQVEFRPIETLMNIDVGLVFANELIDSFPVHRVTKQKGQLAEFYVDLDPEDRFVWQAGPLSTERLAEHFKQSGIDLAEGQIAEVNLEAEEWLALVANKLKRGYLVLVDYGAEADALYQLPFHQEGSLRAFRRHAFVDPLSSPGEHDITTTVDWTFIRRVSEQLGFKLVDFQQQDKFLLDAGIIEELELRVAEAEGEIERIKLRTEAREMLPGGMSESFQVLVLEKL